MRKDIDRVFTIFASQVIG